MAAWSALTLASSCATKDFWVSNCWVLGGNQFWASRFAQIEIKMGVVEQRLILELVGLGLLKGRPGRAPGRSRPLTTLRVAGHENVPLPSEKLILTIWPSTRDSHQHACSGPALCPARRAQPEISVRTTLLAMTGMAGAALARVRWRGHWTITPRASPR